MVFNKSFIRSKTLWVNAIAFVVLLAQGFFGFPVSPELQAGALVLINVGLRTVTSEPIVWK